MTLWELAFRCQYEPGFVRLSNELPDHQFFVWRFGGRACLLVPSLTERELRTLSTVIARCGFAIEGTGSTPSSSILSLVESNPPRPSISEAVGVTGGHLVTPWMYRAGWGHFRVLSIDERAASSLFTTIGRRGPVELQRKVELPLEKLVARAWIPELVGNLTAHQLDALVQARREGYYTIPRTTTTAKMAKRRGVVRSTFEQHLRRAENKVLDSVLGLVEIPTLTEPPGVPGESGGPLQAPMLRETSGFSRRSRRSDDSPMEPIPIDTPIRAWPA